jgi:hypothetical protein
MIRLDRFDADGQLPRRPVWLELELAATRRLRALFLLALIFVLLLAAR